MVGEPNLISLTSGIDNVICENAKEQLVSWFRMEERGHDMSALTVVQIEQKAARVLIVDLSSSFGLVLRYQFAAILRDEFIFLSRIFQENTPTSNF